MFLSARLFLGLLIIGISIVAEAEPCLEARTYLEVNVSQAKLFLCTNGQIAKNFDVALGRGGVDKKMEGDGRNPLGKYEIGLPMPSWQYTTFIPIGYPTEQQRHQGYTGSDVGVHGPRKIARGRGKPDPAVNWTEGCIAVGTDAEIFEIANWVNEHSVSMVTIH